MLFLGLGLILLEPQPMLFFNSVPPDSHSPIKLFIVFSSASQIESCSVLTAAVRAIVLIILRARVNLIPRHASNLALVSLSHHN